MTMKTTVAVSLVMLLALACGGNDKPAAQGGTSPSQQVAATNAAATPLTPEELGELGAKIRKTPERANEILRDRGLDQKSFETEIRKVTEDPEASKRYTAAYKRAG
jgi:hypothetical protein